jgi:nucleotide-binding universal stress UspA family protein
MKVLIAYDGSKGAEAVLRDVLRAGLPGDVEAIVLAAADFWLPPEPGLTPTMPAAAPRAELRAAAKRAVNDALVMAERARARLAAQFSGWQLSAEAVADAPAWAIIKRAEDWSADLVVLGSRGQSPVRRWILGSVSLKVLMELRRSVRIARGRSQPAEGPVRLMVAVDGSPGGAAATRAAAARHWPAGSEARVVTAVDARVAAEPHVAALGVEAWSQKVVEDAAQTLRGHALTVSTVVARGDPKAILPDEATKWAAECIFIGARGMTRIERYILGSVSTAIAMRAPCSVEVVHPTPAGQPRAMAGRAT